MKKILTIIGLSLIGLIAITTIVLAVVQTSFMPITGVEDNILRVEIYQNNNQGKVYLNNDTDVAEKDKYTKLNDLYSKSSSESMLTAMLQGSFGFKSQVTSASKTQSSFENDLYKNGTYMKIVYSSEQTLKIGKDVYKDANDAEVKYNGIVVTVSDTDVLTEYTIYLIKDKTSTGNASFESKYTVTAIGKQADLYDYITALYTK